jgi:hypothetical protein
LTAGSEGVSTFDELDAFCCRLVNGRCNENVDVIGHDDEAVELEPVFGLMLEERLDEEFGVGCALEVAVSLECQYGDGVGALLLADCGHAYEHTQSKPDAKASGYKPLFHSG